MHQVISPAILYWGTPVVLISTLNEDGSTNIAPMSSAWWLGHRAVIGLAAIGQTTQNIRRTGACVLNLPGDNLAGSVNRLARTTGTYPVPEWKAANGYVHVKDKFGHAGLTPQPGHVVAVPRIAECPVQMEAVLVESLGLMSDLPGLEGSIVAFELKIVKVHVEEDLRLEGYPNRIDTHKWHPMIMCFQELYGMGTTRLEESVLARVGEENYRGLTGGRVVEEEDISASQA